MSNDNGNQGKVVQCLSCGGDIVDDKAKYLHFRKCSTYIEEGKDHLRCRVCGYKSANLSRHISIHGLNIGDYREKFGMDSLIVLKETVKKRSDSNRGQIRVPICNRKTAVRCDKCGEVYDSRYSSKHFERCLVEHSEAWIKGTDYVLCPECSKPFMTLDAHLMEKHGWTKEKLSSYEGQRVAFVVDRKRRETNICKYGGESPMVNLKVREKAKATLMDRIGVANPFESSEIRRKISETNIRKYGVEYPMQNEDVFARQNKASQNGPTLPEKILIDALPKNAVFTGYGARFIKVKKGVMKYGKIQYVLCPDFMVFPDSVLSVVKLRSLSGRDMRGSEFYSRFVIEVFGDYWHSEKIIGVSKETHVKETIEAYNSVGIDCLILWEKDIKTRWSELEPMISAWVERASDSMNLLVPFSGKVAEDNVLESLDDASYWRSLKEDDRIKVIDEICKIYSGIEFPYPSEGSAMSDFGKFMAWSKGAGFKPSKYGDVCCRYFVRSVFFARVKGKRSKYELWHDNELMRKTVKWQLENESGSHNAWRFMNALTHSQGFRSISNMSPSKAVCWIRKNANPVRGGILFDPCAGWGGRMLAAHALGMRYRAVDANSILVDELNAMAKSLNIDAVVVCGSSADTEVVKSVMGGEQADVVFTSPPYFDREDYSDDVLQSSHTFTNINEWYLGFMANVLKNSVDVLKDGGIALFNVFSDFNVVRVRDSIPYSIDDFEVSVSFAHAVGIERMMRIEKGNKRNISCEPVSCSICGKSFHKIGWHLRAEHGLSFEEYSSIYPEASKMSDSIKTSICNAGKNRIGIRHVKRTAYRCPDGSIVGKKDAWIRAWGTTTPPQDSIVDGSLFDPWKGKVEGQDFVVCTLCGYKAKNLSRHLNREHGGVAGYVGQIKSSRCVESLSKGANASWDVRGRKEKRDVGLNKTHKEHGLTEEVLRKTYLEDGLSDAKIGERYGITGEGVAYFRKKFGIATRSRKKSQTGQFRV